MADKKEEEYENIEQLNDNDTCEVPTNSYDKESISHDNPELSSEEQGFENKEVNDEKIVKVDDEERTESDVNEWLDILGNGLLKKKIIKHGVSDGKKPVVGEQVSIKTKGLLENGKEVDVHDEITFIVGDGDVITAWDLCVVTMCPTEICEVMSDARFAYGTFATSDVPANSQITYILELICIKAGPDLGKLTDEQRIEMGDYKRQRGNELFQRQEFSQAVYSYSRALKYLQPSHSEDVLSIKIKCWNNIAAAQLKLLDYNSARVACDSVLKVEPSNIKALFRKGKVLCCQGEFEEALEILKKAHDLDPENNLVKREMNHARKKHSENRKKEKDMYERMINGLNNKVENQTDHNTFFTWPVIIGITGVTLGGILAALLFTNKH